MNFISIAFFILVASSLYFGLHYYIYFSITRSLLLSPIQLTSLRTLLTLAGLSFILSEFVRRRTTIPFLTTLGSIWLGMLAIAFTVFVAKDLILLLLPAYKKMITYMALCCTFLAWGISIYNGMLPPKLKEVTVPIANLPMELSGFTIVHLSDIHLNRHTSEKAILHMVEQINELNADAIFITGDLVDDKLKEEHDGLAAAFRGLKSKHGAFTVSGNHEFYAGIDYFHRFVEKANLTLLDNQRITLADTIEVIGLPDDSAHRFSLPYTALEILMEDIDPQKPTILLNHKPTGFERAAELGVDLQLSGHTHGGQIPPLNLLVPFAYKYAYGLYQYNNAHIYTTSGTGLWGPPMRLFTRSEIVRITLQAHQR